MYKIKLANGIELINLTLNGNNYISKNIIADSAFENNLSKVSIFEDGAETIHEDMQLIQNKVYGSESWFILTEKTDKEKLEELSNIRIEQLIAENKELDLVVGDMIQLLADKGVIY